MKGFLIALLLAIFAGEAICESNLSKAQTDLIKTVAEKLDSLLNEFLQTRIKDMNCKLPSDEDQLKIPENLTIEEFPVVKSFECSDSKIKLFDLKLKADKNAVTFYLQHDNVKTEIKIDNTLPLKAKEADKTEFDLEPYTVAYLQRCISRFMEKFYNIPLNIHEIKADLEKMLEATGLEDKEYKVTFAKESAILLTGIKQGLSIQDDKELSGRVDKFIQSLANKPTPRTKAKPQENKAEQKPKIDYLFFKVALGKTEKESQGEKTNVVLAYLPDVKLIAVHVFSNRLNFEYEFNVVTRPFIIGNISSLFGKIDKEVFQTLQQVLSQQTKSLESAIEEFLKDKRFTQECAGVKEPILPAGPKKFQSSDLKFDVEIVNEGKLLTVYITRLSSKKAGVVEKPAQETVTGISPQINVNPPIVKKELETKADIVQMSFANDSVYNLFPFAKEFIVRAISDLQTGCSEKTDQGSDKNENICANPQNIDPFVRSDAPITNNQKLEICVNEAMKSFVFEFTPIQQERKLSFSADSQTKRVKSANKISLGMTRSIEKPHTREFEASEIELV